MLWGRLLPLCRVCGHKTSNGQAALMRPNTHLQNLFAPFVFALLLCYTMANAVERRETKGMHTRSTTQRLCLAAILAALYAGLTLGLQAISFGPVQFRLAEALTLLPVLFPEAVAGLALGCLLGNLFGPAGAVLYDVVFGTLATLLAALLTRRLRHAGLWLCALPPVVVNAVVVGLVLTYAYGINLLWMNMLTVGLGEAVVCYGLGLPLIRLLSKQPGLADNPSDHRRN